VAYDLTGSTSWKIEGLGQLSAGAEWAVITGGTTFGPTADFRRHDLLQIAAAVRTSLDRGNHGAVLDFVFATGDENFDDQDQNVEVYGGPLFAFSEAAYADPFNTRINGGDPHNALGGRPARFYGTELDLGTRYQAFVSTAEITLGLEAGVLFPGAAFHQLDGG